MVPGEQVSVAVKQHSVPAGMSWRRNRDQVVRQFERLIAFNSPLDSGQRRSNLARVDDSFAAEMRLKPRMIGHVIDVRKEHPTDTTDLLDLLHQARCESW